LLQYKKILNKWETFNT